MNYTELLKNRSFQFHWLSGFIAQTGNFFSFVAMPWLILGITNNNPLIMATVMATASLPQAFFILFGGVLSDRLSPLKILFISRLSLVVVILSFASLIYINAISLWMLYAYAFSTGLLGAIAIPASQALLPSILKSSHLAIANGVVMGSMQIAQILGPIAAGWIIWFAKTARGVAENQTDTIAIAIAFSIDALGIFVAFLLMFFIHPQRVYSKKENIMLMLKQGFSFCWRDKGISTVLFYLALVSFFLHGVLMATLPIFIKINLGLGEQAYGSLYAMVGIGAIIGIIIGVITKPSAKYLSMLVLTCDLINAVALIGLGKSLNFSSAAVCLLFMGVCGGIVMIAGTTWFQQRTPDYLMGRVMGILMFSIIGLMPLSATIAGILITHYPVTLIMKASGSIIFIFVVIGFLIPRVRYMGDFPIVDELLPLAPVKELHTS